jgi:4-hydroxybenzoate polyprenyltransferase
MLRFKTFLKLVHIEQTLFALPWALAGGVLPFVYWTKEGAFPYSLQEVSLKLVWIIVAFIAARVAGMSFNRLIDSRIDAKNPRTQQRLVASGRVKKYEVALLAWGSVALFVWSCYSINKLCLMLSPLAILLLWGYAYTKRFTSLCHFVLGAVLFLAPVFAWMAMTETLSWAPIFLGWAVLCSITATDILYAFVDRKFDKEFQVRSIPATLGVRRSILLAKFLHLLAVLSLVGLGFYMEMPYVFFVGVFWMLGLVIRLYFKIKSLPSEKMFIPAFQFNSRFSLSIFVVTLLSWLSEAITL